MFVLKVDIYYFQVSHKNLNHRSNQNVSLIQVILFRLGLRFILKNKSILKALQANLRMVVLQFLFLVRIAYIYRFSFNLIASTYTSLATLTVGSNSLP